ncbi:MAG: VCBS repeat-containing protein [Planctomycetes bacterium]|nr:VCBS repeat-containing protein [Planctomycetota bacterium]
MLSTRPATSCLTGGVLLLLAGALEAQLSFRAELNVPVPHPPGICAAGDFDGDGLQDLIMACDLVEQLAIAWGHPSGLLSEPSTIPTGVATASLRVADLNGDGLDDVVTGFVTLDEIWVQTSNGDRTFAPVRVIDIPGNARDLDISDLDGDGDLDMVAVSTIDAVLIPLRGFGDATFEVLPPRSTSATPWRVRSGDFDEDGVRDVVVGSFQLSELDLFVGLPGFDFAPVSILSMPQPTRELLVGDFDADTHLDLVSICTNACSTARLLLGDGAGGFTPLSSFVAPDDVRSPVAVDFDADGYLDVAWVRNSQDALELHRGSATGAFTLEAPQLTGRSPRGLAALDVDHDALVDWVTTNNEAMSLTQIRREPGGLFASNGTLYNPTFMSGAWLRDYDGDGHIDIGTEIGGNQFAVLLGDGMGGLTLHSTVAIGNSTDIAFGDFNEDGIEDFVSPTYGGLSPGAPVARVVLMGPTATALSTLTFTLPGTDHTAAVADFDEDGHLDLVLAASAADSFVDEGLYFYAGDGDGTFQPPVHFDFTTDIERVRSADFDGDGHADIATMTCNATGRVHLGGGNGTFVPSATVIAHGSLCNLSGMAIGDFDGNGYPDLAVHGNGSVAVLPSLGPAGFGPTASAPAPGTGLLFVGDLNGDGRATPTPRCTSSSAMHRPSSFPPSTLYGERRCR